MNTENWLLEKDGQVACLALNRPPANAISFAVLVELEQLLDRLEVDPGTHVIVLTAVGARYFSAGADVAEFGAYDPRTQIELGQRVTSRIERFGKPIIAAINGACVGGGNELAMAAHVRFASTNAQFGQPEVKLGLVCGWGGTQRLPRLIGRSRAAEYLLTGDRMTAEQAERWGLVSRIYSPAEVLPETMAFAARLAHGAPLALRAALDCMEEGFRNGYEAGSRKELETLLTLGQSEDAGTGIAAFLTRTAPQFKGQ